MTYDDQPEAKVAEQGRVRRSTIERFNDELAVLDRPLEEDVEYYDDPPPRSPWRRVVAVAGGAALLGGLAAFVFTHRSATVSDDNRAPSAALVSPAAAPSAAPVAAAPPAPLALNEPPAPPAHDAAPSRGQPSAGAWTTIKPAAHETSGRTKAHHSRHRHHGRHH
jgi:hypothetical protein